MRKITALIMVVLAMTVLLMACAKDDGSQAMASVAPGTTDAVRQDMQNLQDDMDAANNSTQDSADNAQKDARNAANDVQEDLQDADKALQNAQDDLNKAQN